MWMWGAALLVGLYTTLVLESLWNWFAVPSLHAPELSYWAVYGLQLMIGLLSQGSALSEIEQKTQELLLTVLDFCIPEDRMEEARQAIEHQEQSAWVTAGFSILHRVAGNTLTLAIGFSVHALFL